MLIEQIIYLTNIALANHAYINDGLAINTMAYSIINSMVYVLVQSLGLLGHHIAYLDRFRTHDSN